MSIQLPVVATFEDKVSPGLQKIQERATKVADKFGELAGAIAGLALVGFATKAVNSAIALKNMSDATGVSINTVDGFANALTAAGGSMDRAMDGLSDLTKNIGDAATGSKELVTTFSKVGVSIEDLGKLSEEEILKKTLAGLAKIPDAATRTSTAMKLMGESVKGVNLSQLNKELDGYIARSRISAVEVAKFQQAQANINVVVNRFQESLVKAIAPLADFLSKMDPAKFDKVVDAIVSMSVSIAALAGSLKVLQYLGAALAVIGTAGAAYMLRASTAIAGLGATAAGAAIRFGGFLKAFGAAEGVFAKLVQVGKHVAITIGKTMSYLLVDLAKLIPVVGAFVAKFNALALVLAAVALKFAAVAAAIVGIDRLIKTAFDVSPIDYLASKLENLITDKFPRLAAAINSAGEFLGMGSSASKMAKDAQDATDRMRNASRKANAEFMAQKKKEQEATGRATAMLQDQAKEIQKISEAYKKQNQNLIDGYNFEARMVGKSKEYVEVQRALFELQSRSRTEIDKLVEAKNKLAAGETHLMAVYDQQIAKIQEQTKVDAARISGAIKGLQQVNLQEETRLSYLEAATRAMERQQDIEEQMRSLSQDIARQFEDMQLEGMTDSYERGLKQIQVATERRVQEIRQQFEKLIDENILDPQAVQRYTEELIRLEEQVRKLGDAEQERFKKNNPRTFAEGWKKAMDDYVDNLTNAAKRGAQAFDVVMNNMERAIDNFVETGKFSFKDFARSIILELLKIEMKAATANLWKILAGSWGGGGGGGGLFGGSIIPGFLAEGGPAQANKPYIVGERGPELFVPKGSGTVVPNNQLGASQPVTNNYVYNISAVDAQSVARLFTSNRQILLGSVEQAKKELPTRRGMR